MTGRPRTDGRGRVSEGPVPIGHALHTLAGQLGVGRPDAVALVFGRWDELVGPSVAAHVQPVRLVGDTLVVRADHHAWATQIRHVAPDILARVAAKWQGDGAPNRLEVRIRS